MTNEMRDAYAKEAAVQAAIAEAVTATMKLLKTISEQDDAKEIGEFHAAAGFAALIASAFNKSPPTAVFYSGLQQALQSYFCKCKQCKQERRMAKRRADAAKAAMEQKPT